MLNKKETRLANIELLRIVSMLMVITLHFLGRGGINSFAQPLSTIWFLSIFFDGLSIISVNIYVLISGYFLINSKFKISKLLGIVLQVFFYSSVLYLISILFGLQTFSLISFANAFLPILTNQYWFASAYIGLYILFPFLNKAIHALNKQQHKLLCIILICMFALYLPSTTLGQSGTSIVWLICLYVIAAYIRLHYKPKEKLSFILILSYIIPTLLLPLSKVIIMILSSKIEGIEKYSGWFYKYNSILVLWSSISLFIIFLNFKINNFKISLFIRFFASATFGVYLLHNNPSLRDYFWSVLNITSFINNLWSIFAYIGIIIAIFLTCTFIEVIRKKICGYFAKIIIIKKFVDFLDNFTKEII